MEGDQKTNIELHDIRWVVGSKIEDNYDTLRNDWYGYQKKMRVII